MAAPLSCLAKGLNALPWRKPMKSLLATGCYLRLYAGSSFAVRSCTTLSSLVDAAGLPQ
jgi:hypothetical protein